MQHNVPAHVIAALCKHTGADSAQLGETLQALWSGYGKIRRLQLSGGSPSSVILKQVQPPPAPSADDPAALRSHQRKLDSYAVELAFYQQRAWQCSSNCRVARPLLCERQTQGWLFALEDLDAAGYGARHSSFFRPGGGTDPRAIQSCLRWLAHFHAIFMQTDTRDLWHVGTYWHLATRPDELAASVEPQLRQAARWLDRRLRGATYRTLVHGDAKVENFCFSADDTQVAAVDFQYVGGGVGVQDVAYFLGSCLDDRACATWAPQLLDIYFEALGLALEQYQPQLDPQQVEAEWRGLYFIAWADFCRFLSGWAPTHSKLHGYSRYCVQQALAELPTGD